MRIKICGITRVEDALTAADAGADAIGLVFAKSPRRVSVARARQIVAALPPFVVPVGVFVNVPVERIRDVAEAVGLSVVQLHGDENRGTIARLAPLRVIRAIRVRDRQFAHDVTLYATARPPHRPAALLLDAFDPRVRGGTGSAFEWQLAADAQRAGALDGAPPLILAGGLTATNVGRAISVVNPDGVDVSGGVESAPGIKDKTKIRKFMDAVRTASRGLPSGGPSGRRQRR